MSTKPFESARERVRAEDAGKWNTLAPREEVLMENGRITLPRLTPNDYPEGWQPSARATARLCQRLSIPTPYFRRCPTDLQDAQFNYWRSASRNSTNGANSHRRERWLLRTRGEQLRGVLTERYACLDKADLLRCLAPMVEERFEIAWFALTDESLHLRIVDPRLAREALPHDRLVAGLHIANSEVGMRAVTVDALVYRLVCSNGMIRLVQGRSLLYQRHVALSKSGFEAALRTAVREAFIHGAGFIERLIQATSETISDMDGTLKALAARWNLTESTHKQIRKALLMETSGQQETLYGLVNALTNAAQTLSPDDRYDLEALAGKLVEISTRQIGLPALSAGRSRAPALENDPEEFAEEPIRLLTA
jgi:hypothetical protein